MEFALFLPFLLLLLGGGLEVGRAFYQASAVEKGIRAAASYLGRLDEAPTGADIQAAENLAKTGTLNGTGALLVSGWGVSGATFTVVTKQHTIDDQSFPVYSVSASVPFDPMVPGLADLLGLGGYTIQLNHEQAQLGT
ncbi:MAG: pilus assembly protein [Rhodospirillales bacterium]|nr:pilus assembly protein [Rhodospirillales bacterium]MCW8953180.1 pilus assembly protein [Rhodospirillales bacterium]